MRNIHIYPSAFTHESRILKEVATLSARLGFDDIDLVGVGTAELPPVQLVTSGIVVRRLGPSKGQGVMKALRHVIWCLHVMFFCFRRGPDIVNCHSLPTLPIGVLVKLLSGARLVYDAHELETETAGTRESRRRVARVLERWCMPFVDLTIVVSPGIEAWYRDRYGIKAIATVLNTPHFRESAATSVNFSQILGIDTDKKILLYQGGLSPGRGLEVLTEAASALFEAGYVLVLMGYGPLEEALRQQAKSKHFYVCPAVDPEILLNYTAAADIGLCLIEDVCLSYHLSLPNKLFEYVMARIPIVASDLPEIRKVVHGNQIGACIPSWDIQSIVDTVCAVKKIPMVELQERLEKLAKAYSWKNQEDVMCKAYETYVLVECKKRQRDTVG